MEGLVEELKRIIGGQILSDEQSLEHYSTDGSIFKMKPWAIVLPRGKDDTFRLVKWLADKKQAIGHSPLANRLSVTCRGKATDQAGGPINDGIILRFPGYLDKILEVGEDFIRVEPGVLWGKMFEELDKIGRFVPCYPASYKFASIGGGAANNCSGEKTVKYGSMRDYILSLRMVLADGSEAEFKPLSAEEITKKQAKNNLEGEIYRQMSDLLISNHNLIQNARLRVDKNSTGYWLYDVLTENGGMNLCRLIAGSQGTLGIINEVMLKTIPRPAMTGLLAAVFNDLERAGLAVPRILKIRPSAFELVDKFLLEMIVKEKPEMVAGLMTNRSAIPELLLLIEFDGSNLPEIKNQIQQAKNLIGDLMQDFYEAYDKESQDTLWQARRSAAIVAEKAEGAKKSLPFIEDTIVPPDKLARYLNGLYQILQKYQVAFSVWGHAGNGNLHLQPFFDLGDQKDVEQLFAIAQEVYKLAINLGGALSGEHSDGLMRTPFLKDQFSEPMIKIFEKVKQIFDPQNIFNPRKKVGADLEFIKKHLRKEYVIEIGSQAT